MYKVLLKKNTKYSICSCGLSKVMPFCDNAHRLFNDESNSEFKSIKITPDKDVSVMLSSSAWNDGNRKK